MGTRRARGGDGTPYAWGEEFVPDERLMANTWQGQFPWQHRCRDGYERTSPVGAIPPNGYGLYDMIGNVWEWTTDWYVPKHPPEEAKACCIPHNPRGPREEDSYDPCQPRIEIPRKVLKCGSRLCAPNYCRRYRPAARFPEPVDTSTCHVGFRCIVRSASGPDVEALFKAFADRAGLAIQAAAASAAVPWPERVESQGSKRR